MLGIALGSTALGLAGNIWANSQAAEANRQYNDYMQQSLEEQKKVNQGRKTDLESTFNKEYYQNYLDTEAARALQKRFSQYSKDAMENIRGQATASGATPEAVVAQQKTIGDQYNDLLGNLAEKATSYKMGLQNQKNMQKLGLWQMDDSLKSKTDAFNAQRFQNKLQSANNLSSNISGATSGLLNAWAEGAFG